MVQIDSITHFTILHQIRLQGGGMENKKKYDYNAVPWSAVEMSSSVAPTTCDQAFVHELKLYIFFLFLLSLSLYIMNGRLKS